MTAQLRLSLPKPRRRPGRPRLPKCRRKRWHERRPVFDGSNEPLLITLKLKPGLPRLRGKLVLRRVRRAMERSRVLFGLNVVHFSILDNHLHLLVESAGKEALTSQMKSLAITLARNLNPLWKRKGALFADRYHSEVLASPTRTRNAITYVLTNEWKHRGRRGKVRLDLRSSAAVFSEWARLIGASWSSLVESAPGRKGEIPSEPFASLLGALLDMTDPPWSWLLREGWSKA